MTTNREWLNSLASTDIPGLDAWMNAEHTESNELVDNLMRGVVENMSAKDAIDSREKLETDIHRWLTSHVAVSVYAKDVEAEVYGWLDRQAAITEQECAWRWRHIAEARDRAEIERDALAAELKECMELNDKLSDERERWRGTCGMMTDAAHEIERILAEMEAK